MIRFWATDSRILGLCQSISWLGVRFGLIRDSFYTSGDEICYLWVGFRPQKLSFRRLGINSGSLGAYFSPLNVDFMPLRV